MAFITFLSVTAYIVPVNSIATAPTVDEPVVIVEMTKQDYIDLAYFYANMYGVSGDYMVSLVNCENGSWDPERQAMLKYAFSDPKRGIVKGEQEQSWGLAMIHLPDHPSVSLEQAQDADFSLNFMAEHLSRGQNIWYCKNLI